MTEVVIPESQRNLRDVVCPHCQAFKGAYPGGSQEWANAQRAAACDSCVRLVNLDVHGDGEGRGGCELCGTEEGVTVVFSASGTVRWSGYWDGGEFYASETVEEEVSPESYNYAYCSNCGENVDDAAYGGFG